MLVTVALVSLLMGYAWDFYFSGRETMRHGVSQSQMQSEARIFYDRLGKEIPSVYRFIQVDTDSTERKKFSYYCFVTYRTPVESILFNETTGYGNGPLAQKFRVLQVTYEWEATTKEVKRSQVLGDLLFLRKPMEFQECGPNEYENSPYAPYTKVVLKNAAKFEVKAFQQKMKTSFGDNEIPFELKEITGAAEHNASSAAFIAMRVHNKIEEKGNRKDEELDLVCKFYSRYQLAEANYPGFFSTIDHRAEF
jgi:hypothetical protein